MNQDPRRRDFLKALGLMALGAHSSTPAHSATGELFFKISLAEWSLHRMLQAGRLDNLDFPARARSLYGISAVEYVNQFFMDKARDRAYLAELKKRSDDHGVTNVLIMCDDEGGLANLDSNERTRAVENHYKWVEAARFLGCHSIRVNCFGVGPREEVAQAGAAGLRKLSEFAAPLGIGVIVENHGGYSSDGRWLGGVIQQVGLANCGTLPDFGNFCIRRQDGSMWDSPCVESYDRYKGVAEMMPYAKGVSAKSYDFDERGNCTETDFVRMLKVVRDAGYRGHVGIEYEGEKLSEDDGIRATKALLERAGGGPAV